MKERQHRIIHGHVVDPHAAGRMHRRGNVDLAGLAGQEKRKVNGRVVEAALQRPGRSEVNVIPVPDLVHRVPGLRQRGRDSGPDEARGAQHQDVADASFCPWLGVGDE